MSDLSERASWNFFKIALEYYVSGRAAAFCGCLITTGNLLHHAVEMLLKGKLCHTVPLDDLKDRKKFGHSLPKCWDAFKTLFPSEDLSEFDQMIQELDRFETIRYPDEIVANGARVGIGFCRGRVFRTIKSVNLVPEYRTGILDVDDFFARLMLLCRMNPNAYFMFVNVSEHGREMLTKYNDHAKDWL
ncbi:MAG TPA: hypothetical protein VH682_28205 [Gemmataceae bacterium]